ncbi:MAG TPA: hypothetical protein VGW78_03540 [Candidatus Babeliales bacterium]|jgi:hypothetical protein|nr:hypothetical protein [Candidatus Babeliales bacterium]
MKKIILLILITTSLVYSKELSKQQSKTIKLERKELRKKKYQLLSQLGLKSTKKKDCIIQEGQYTDNALYEVEKKLATMLYRHRSHPIEHDIELLQKELMLLHSKLKTYNKRIKQDPKGYTIAFGIEETKNILLQKIAYLEQELETKKALGITRKTKFLDTEAPIKSTAEYAKLNEAHKEVVDTLQIKRDKLLSQKKIIQELLEIDTALDAISEI